MQLEHKSLAFDLKASSDDESGFEGYGSVFFVADSYGDIIPPGAFKSYLPFFIQKGVILNQHRMSEPIGKPKSAKEDDHGLFLKARISDTERGRELKTLMKDEVIQSLSIGFVPTVVTWFEGVEEVKKYWKSVDYKPTKEDLANVKYGARLLSEIKLYEISPVTFPANGYCDITAVKSEAPAARSFADHSEAVLATVEEFVTRAASLKELREEDGRGLSQSARRRLLQLKDQIEALMGAPPVITEESVPSDELRRLQAEFYAKRVSFQKFLAG